MSRGELVEGDADERRISTMVTRTRSIWKSWRPSINRPPMTRARSTMNSSAAIVACQA